MSRSSRATLAARSDSSRILALACVFATVMGVVSGAQADGEPPKKDAPAPSATNATPLSAPMPGGQKTPLKFLPAGAFFPDEGPSRVVYPAQKITIRFNHKKHMKDFGLDCAACHGDATKSTKVEDRLLPAPKVCDDCHGSNHSDLAAVKGDGDMATCTLCHVGYKQGDGNAVAKMVWPVAHMKSNHKAHADRNIKCESCHGAVQELELATEEQLGRMRGCFGCHAMPGAAAGTAKSDCEVCHVTTLDGRIEANFKEGKLLPPRWQGNLQHTPDFIDRHKRVAAENSQACSSCHKEDFCTDCHDGRVRPRNVHANDYISMHPIEARLDNPRCASCHQEQQFCLPCHQRSGVTQTASPGNAKGQGRFHPAPAVWSELPRTRQHHAWEAQRNINACVSCHTERDCAVCHGTFAAGGRGFNPHPPGFASKCGHVLSKNPRPCLVCHEGTDSKLAGCK